MTFRGLVIGGPWDGAILDAMDDRINLTAAPEMPLRGDLAAVRGLEPTVDMAFAYAFTRDLTTCNGLSLGLWLPADGSMSLPAALNHVMLGYHRFARTRNDGDRGTIAAV